MTSPLRSSGAPAPASTDDRPELRLVAGRRQFAWFAMVVMILSAGLLMGSIYLHTRLTARQLEIDRLDRELRTAQQDFDVLRAERAVLRSPTRLADEAGLLGMIPGRESEFVPVDPMLLATVIAQTGELPTLDEITPGSLTRLGPLDQYRLAKSIGQELP